MKQVHWFKKPSYLHCIDTSIQAKMKTMQIITEITDLFRYLDYYIICQILLVFTAIICSLCIYWLIILSYFC